LIPYQVPNFNTECVGDDFECLDRNVALAALDLAHVRTVQAGSVGEDILGPLPFKPKRSDGVPDPLLNILHCKAVSRYSG
jgi:hypothetical protein